MHERVPAEYTEQEYKDWLTEAGFEQAERATLPNGDGVITALFLSGFRQVVH
jgi:hypothetical protein